MKTSRRAIDDFGSVPVPTYKLRDICERITKGSTPTSYGFAYTTEGIRFIKAENIDSNGFAATTTDHIDEATNTFLQRSILQENDILFSIAGTIGRVGLLRAVDLPANTNQALAIVRPRSGVVEPKYLLHYLKSEAVQKHALKRIVGVGRANLSLAELGDISVPVISLHAQRAVVAEIEKQVSRLDQAVASLKRVKANLKRYKASVFHEIFHESPNAMLGDLIKSGPQNGLYLPKSKYGSGIPILRIDDYQTAWIRRREKLRLVSATREQIETWSLSESDLVINRVNSMTHLGKCVVVPPLLAGAMFESNMMRLRLNERASPEYIEYYLASEIGKKRLTQNAKWAVNQASINQKDVRGTPVFVPDISVQHIVVAAIDRQFSIVRGVDLQADANLKRAERMRQAILAKMFGAPVGAVAEEETA